MPNITATVKGNKFIALFRGAPTLSPMVFLFNKGLEMLCCDVRRKHVNSIRCGPLERHLCPLSSAQVLWCLRHCGNQPSNSPILCTLRDGANEQYCFSFTRLVNIRENMQFEDYCAGILLNVPHLLFV